MCWDRSSQLRRSLERQRRLTNLPSQRTRSLTWTTTTS